MLVNLLNKNQSSSKINNINQSSKAAKQNRRRLFLILFQPIQLLTIIIQISLRLVMMQFREGLSLKKN